MTIKLNLDRVEHRPTVTGGDFDTSVHAAPLHGSVTGQIAVGRYVVQIGDTCGALIGEASQVEQPQIHARPTPIILRPQPTRGLLDRGMELAAALSALDAGLPVEMSGEPGIGKTAVLRHIAHHPHASSFADGIIYMSVRRQSTDDLLQLIFEAFHESDKIRTPTEAEIRRGLQDTQALILLDDVYASQPELERVFECAPRSAFVVSTRERCLWGEARSVTLKGMPVEDGVRLLEREIERSLDGTERSAAIHLCTALGGHPRRIQQAAALIRDQRISLDRLDRNITPAKLMADSMASIDEKPRRALLALTALAGVPLSVQHVSGIAEVIDLEPSLIALTRRGLVVITQSRYLLSDGVSDYLRRTEDLKPWVNRAITYFTAWAERYRRSPSNLLEESEALLRIQECAIDARRWGEVLHLGRLLEGALIAGARWGAWAITLDRCLTAAKSIGDRSAEAWTLHEMGTRALCLGEADKARAQLGQAMKLREAMGDDEGAAASRRNLGFVLAPVSNFAAERPATLVEQVLDLDSFRDGTQPAVRAPKTKSGSLAALVVLMIVLLGGLGYLAISPGLSWTPQDLAGLGAFLHRDADQPTVRTASTEQILQAQARIEPRVQRFSAFPDRIVPGESVGLCYEVANGSSVRIDPDVGEVGALGRNCVSAKPTQTTTYMLTAVGTSGESTRQTTLVQVGSSAWDKSQPRGAGVLPPRSESKPVAVDSSPDPALSVGDRARIRIFTPRPGSIATGSPVELCYAVDGALHARVDPGVGEVTPASRLTCLRVAPVRTTTYELSAYGRDNLPVRQQLVIVVR